MAQGCTEISTGVQSTYRLKCFEDYFAGISVLLDRAQWEETGTMGETDRQTQREGERDSKKEQEEKLKFTRLLVFVRLKHFYFG